MHPNHKPNFTNRPKHLKQNDSFYFFTVRTIEAQWFLRPDKYKEILLLKIKEKTAKFNFTLIAYVICHNHYHLILKIADANLIPKFIAELNGASARAINQADEVIQRKVWWNYYDHIIRDEADFFKHLNYTHQNPVKHALTKDFDYKFSSYNSWLKQKGHDYMTHVLEKYPVIDFTISNDEF